ncbi:MAG TPA: molybdopterin-synthase adenylyltransferase MoeB [Gemmatimonadota bacterium]|nr:molybdopterin-synthase adenylyltransferase MoeB [Gemmatimonadota bacterium]
MPGLFGRAAGLELGTDELRRYGRHLSMPEVGEEGQKRLKAARVLLVGAGGLGSPAAMYLGAAGVGTLGLVDFDEVDFSNLHRQLLHGTADVGRPKLDSARERLLDLNPEVSVETFETRLTSENALEVLDGWDVVVDGSDNFPTRYLVNDACVLLGIPNVWGAIFRFEGQASVFGVPGGPCYRCIFREPPPPGAVPSCAEAGVLGILPGLVGTIQAAEAVKLVLGLGRTLAGRLLLVDALEMDFREVEIARDPECPVCGDEPTVTELIDYEAFCGMPGEEAAAGSAGAVGADAASGAEAGAAIGGAGASGDGAGETSDRITVWQLREKLDDGEAPDLVDVREPFEWRICNLEEEGARLVPLSQLPGRLDELDEDREIVVYCHTGSRSALAVRYLRQEGFGRARNLMGGIAAWAEEIDPDMPTY